MKDGEAPKMMHAIVYDHYGDADVLRLEKIETPAPDARHILIKVHAVSVNPIDYRLRSGEAKFLLIGGFPRVPGYDVAGTVVRSTAISDFAPGDRVMAFLNNVRGGAYAQYARCSPTSVAKIPSSMTFEDAAAIPLAGSTALQSLRDHAHLQSGQQVLINGASGGVGVFAVQIAKAYGAIVTGVASHENEAFVRSLGADEFIDYTLTDFTKSGKVWDIIFDAAGKSSYWRSRPVMAKKGYYVSTEPSIQGAAMSIWAKLFAKHGTIMLARPNASDLRELIRLYEAHLMRVEIDKVFQLKDAAQAHRRIQDGVDRGKIVMQVT